ncbi:hypothetical protein [Leucobacter aridicollis]|uniref:Uncharacterized protein n=1 Tax=Leucobacter aridicollis TaxID=283878 RepID=A0A852QXA5_9MICO|nr:hypothetical protein [Leucobacter aridicollis]MBL3682563.1 hypothetical protein [Leucobacter aridicollis]NYD25981.1 hypothetical protein [Leucobacter aridicollis]
MLRLTFFLGLGILLGGVVSALVGPPGAASWAFPVGLITAVVSAVLVLLGKSLRGLALPSEEQVQSALADGRVGLARVDALTQTGTQINEQPVCDIDLTVRPVRGGVYRTRVRRIVQLTQIPRFQPGTRHVVAILAEGAPDVALTDEDATAEIWADTEFPPAAAAGELRLGSAGGAPGSRRPLIGTGKRSRPIRIAVFVLAGLLAGAAVVYPYRAGLAETVAAIPEGRFHADLREPAALDRALTALAAEVGHDRVVSVTVSEDLVTVNAPLTPESLNVDRWTYRKGSVTHGGPGAPQPETLSEQFALTEIDAGAILREVERAAGEAGVNSLDGVMYNASRGLAQTDEDPWNTERSGPVSVSFVINDGYRSSSFRVAPDGSGLESTD